MDHTYFVTGLPLWSKQDTLDTFVAMFEGVASQDIEVVREEVTMLSDTAALYTAEMTYTQYDADSNVLVPTSPYAMTIVFVLRDGKWMNRHSHQSFP
nr:nuclear transport factor 2 family protein [Shewanella waksmanii]